MYIYDDDDYGTDGVDDDRGADDDDNGADPDGDHVYNETKVGDHRDRHKASDNYNDDSDEDD